ncbi:DNA adenine methylase [Mycoplasma wenyonii]|uniref:DNA adenine methylase n=1 Tax=Mycoplasma wenyonii TaxID=65123 RepID=UPI001C658E9C|nr:DNA adenine methylase [Mycoplasma wenyonii]
MNYIGSKHSLIEFLEDTIFQVTGFNKGDHFIFADLFAGTGIVGANFKAKGCTVLANDIQYYSFVLNKHYLENSFELNLQLL